MQRSVVPMRPCGCGTYHQLCHVFRLSSGCSLVHVRCLFHPVFLQVQGRVWYVGVTPEGSKLVQGHHLDDLAEAPVLANFPGGMCLVLVAFFADAAGLYVDHLSERVAGGQG